MENIINGIATDAKIITPQDDHHYFFAYYDMRATGENGKHLCHRVPFFDRNPNADDVAELGYLDDGKFIKFAETTAWNFQQGAMQAVALSAYFFSPVAILCVTVINLPSSQTL